MLSQSHIVNTSIESCTTHLLQKEESQSQSEKSQSQSEKIAQCERAVIATQNIYRFDIFPKNVPRLKDIANDFICKTTSRNALLPEQ